MDNNYKKIHDGRWGFLLEESQERKQVLILVEDLAGEDQLVDLLVRSVSADHPNVGFHRLNTYPEHSILEELGILRLPAMVVLERGAITYISRDVLTKCVVREHLA